MTAELISKRTRNEFREFLVNWVLREIESEFDAAGIACDRKYQPPVGGARRSFVEQHYHTLDFTNPKDARRLVTAYENILAKAEQDLPTSFDKPGTARAIANLVACLKKDGLKYEAGKITPTSPDARRGFDDVPSSRTVTEVTRRAICDEIRIGKTPWAGKLPEIEFVGRLYDLEALASHDGRYVSMADDLWQHRENNSDWPDDWVFSDARLDLLGGSDGNFLAFLCLMAHPVVRPDVGETGRLVHAFNKHLAADGWELAPSTPISGKPTFKARRCTAGKKVEFQPTTEPTDILSDQYVQELAAKCEQRLARGDFDGAVTIGRTVLEAILAELEKRLTGSSNDYDGDLPKQFKSVCKLLRLDDKRKDLDDRFKDVVRGLVAVVHGLAPLRNKLSDGHARVHKPAPHHARLVVNAAKTVAAFLVESYEYQSEKGLVAGPPRGPGKENR